MNTVLSLCEKLLQESSLSQSEYLTILSNSTEDDVKEITKMSRTVTDDVFGRKIYTRGLIEISNICKNDCLYCGIRKSNPHVNRYRLSKEQILKCCAIGYEQGHRTFVLQGGEDPFFSDDIMVDSISSIKSKFSDCAITLSLGERSKDSYKAMKIAGADRYLLRHETICKKHYELLHPTEMSFDNRIECLNNLKDVGYQTGTGIMVGSPFQTLEMVAEDLHFIQNFQPEMVGLGPFLPHSQTPFKDEKKGNLELTLLLISLLRLMNKNLLIPATTSLATLDPQGRELGILAGANVIMPNISPMEERSKYLLYDNKVSFGEQELETSLKKLGFTLAIERGDYNEK